MFQVAFGQLGLGGDFWEMETREFLNAWTGHIEQKRRDYAAMFETARFGAIYNTFSGDQAKAVKKARNPYIQRPKKRASNKQIGQMLSSLAKAFNPDSDG